VLGAHPDGRPWRAATRAGSIDLADNALAVSSGAGTAFEPSGKFHHIFDPATGASAAPPCEVAVTAPRAMIADALATAICVVGEERSERLLAAYPGTRAVVVRNEIRS
jgi:thiamine biosynthesis lipoprotein